MGLSPEGAKEEVVVSIPSDLSGFTDDVERPPQQQQPKQQTHEGSTSTMTQDEENIEAPPPPSDSDQNGISIGNKLGSNLPPNWAAAVSQSDGRVYYYNTQTKETSWMHPNYFKSPIPPPSGNAPDIVTSQTSVSMGDASGIMKARSDNDGIHVFHAMVDKSDSGKADSGIFPSSTYNPNEPINSYRCYSIVAFILFFPLGIFAMYQSFSCVSQWKQQKFALAQHKSQEALLLSRISCALGFFFWVYYLFFSGPGPFALDFQWPAEFHW